MPSDCETARCRKTILEPRRLSRSANAPEGDPAAPERSRLLRDRWRFRSKVSGARAPEPDVRTKTEVIAMMRTFTVGMNVAGRTDTVTVEAEDALIAALKAKHEQPNAMINYVRRSNKRGDLRHPHHGIADTAPKRGGEE